MESSKGVGDELGVERWQEKPPGIGLGGMGETVNSGRRYKEFKRFY